MESLAPVQVARLTLIAFCVFSAVLAAMAWRMPWLARAWGVALAVSTGAYAVCTSGGFQDTTLVAGVTLAFFCSALPAIFWAFVQVLFNDAVRLAWPALLIVAVVGLLGILSSQVSGLPNTIAAVFSALRRMAAIGLVGFSLWSLARGTVNDLVLERWRTRRWMLWLAGAYVLGVLVVEIGLPAKVQPALLTVNLTIIALLTLGLGVALTRWDLTAPAVPTGDQAQPSPSHSMRPGPSTPADEQAAVLVARLERAMGQEYLYRHEGLTIARLATHLDTQEHRLRRVINQHMGHKNYNEFLHRYRLAEAAQRLRDPEQRALPVLTIALEVGYGSIGPFNRAFKAQFGQTPTQYRLAKNH